MLIDAHCHLSRLSELIDLDTVMEEASKRDIKGWLSCALSREEVHWHKINHSPLIKFSAGIHPLTQEGTTLTLDDLNRLAEEKRIFAIGEIGLDKRNSKLEQQIILLKDQLAIARSFNLPCVFHVVGHLDVFYKILSDQPVIGIWHGFTSSSEIVTQFSKFGLTYSLGKVMIDSLKHETVRAVINYGNYLIETDAPYNLKQSENSKEKVKNPLLDLCYYAMSVSRMSGLQPNALQYDIINNVKQYFI
ncbi:MAG TPA: TatD family hydrolase [Candidatus Cloacimonadota bacterium]|nr:TatD family hydrolase [Candidatus Cloacimonadota bacterium]